MKIVKVSIKPETRLPVKLACLPNTIILPDVNYNNLKNIPSLNGVKVMGDKTLEDYGIGSGGSDMEALTNLEIEELLKNFM